CPGGRSATGPARPPRRRRPWRRRRAGRPAPAARPLRTAGGSGRARRAARGGWQPRRYLGSPWRRLEPCPSLPARRFGALAVPLPAGGGGQAQGLAGPEDRDRTVLADDGDGRRRVVVAEALGRAVAHPAVAVDVALGLLARPQAHAEVLDAAVRADE